MLPALLHLRRTDRNLASLFVPASGLLEPAVVAVLAWLRQVLQDLLALMVRHRMAVRADGSHLHRLPAVV